MRYLTFCVFLLYFSVDAFAEDFTPAHQITSAPLDSRFELIQSPLAARGTYRLDKYTGAVHQIVKTKEEDSVWQEVHRRKHPLDRKIEGKVNYQLFASGLAMRFTYLINVNTGATWQLIETQEKDILWSPIP
jgi:hypothetical protein